MTPLLKRHCPHRQEWKSKSTLFRWGKARKVTRKKVKEVKKIKSFVRQGKRNWWVKTFLSYDSLSMWFHVVTTTEHQLSYGPEFFHTVQDLTDIVVTCHFIFVLKWTFMLSLPWSKPNKKMIRRIIVEFLLPTPI